LYGVGPHALARATGTSFEEARQYIERYFAAHPAIAAYMDAQKLKAATEGYVATLYGRRRYLPDMQSGMAMVRAAAERMAINMPIQGTEADILKLAMLAVDAVIREEALPATLLLQVHDELLFEVPVNDAERIAARLAAVMEGVAQLSLRLPVDTALSSDWGSME
jgi:DNA polymerase-1